MIPLCCWRGRSESVRAEERAGLVMLGRVGGSVGAAAAVLAAASLRYEHHNVLSELETRATAFRAATPALLALCAVALWRWRPTPAGAELPASHCEAPRPPPRCGAGGTITLVGWCCLMLLCSSGVAWEQRRSGGGPLGADASVVGSVRRFSGEDSHGGDGSALACAVDGVHGEVVGDAAALVPPPPPAPTGVGLSPPLLAGSAAAAAAAWAPRGGDACRHARSVAGAAPRAFLVAQPEFLMGFHNQRECMVNYALLARALGAALVVRVMPGDSNMPWYIHADGGGGGGGYMEPFRSAPAAAESYFDAGVLRAHGVCLEAWTPRLQRVRRVALSVEGLAIGVSPQTLDPGAVASMVAHAVAAAARGRADAGHDGGGDLVYDLGGVMGLEGLGSFVGSFAWLVSRDVGRCGLSAECAAAFRAVRPAPHLLRLAAGVVARVRGVRGCGGGDCGGGAPAPRCAPLVALHVRSVMCAPDVASLHAPLRAMAAAGLNVSTAVVYFASELAAYAPVMRALRATFAAVYTLADFDDGDGTPLSRALPNGAVAAVNEAISVAADVFVGGDGGASSFDSFVQADRLARGAARDSYVAYPREQRAGELC